MQTIREHHLRIDRSPRRRASPSTRLRALPASRAFAREDRSLHPAPGLRPEPGFRSAKRPKALLGSRPPPRGRSYSLTNEGFAPNSAAGGTTSFSRPAPSGILRPRALPLKRAPRTPTEVSRARGRSLSLSAPPAASCPEAGTRRSFAPTRSARTPPVVRSPRRRHEETSSHRWPEGDSGPACDPTEGRITRVSAKKPEIRRTRGAFHR